MIPPGGEIKPVSFYVIVVAGAIPGNICVLHVVK